MQKILGILFLKENKSNIYRLWKISLKHKYLLIFAVFTLILNTFQTLFIPLKIGNFSQIFSSKDVSKSFLDSALYYFFLFILLNLFDSIHMAAVRTFTLTFVKSMMEYYVKSLFAKDIEFFDKNKISDLFSLLTDDIKNLSDSSILELFDFFKTLAKGIGSLSLMFYFYFKLTCLLIIILPFILYFINKRFKQAKKEHKNLQDQRHGSHNIVMESLENIKTTNEIEIYNFLSDETNLIYFVLKLVFEKFSKSVTKLRIYQIGLKTIDEALFTYVASYLRRNPKIDTFALCGRAMGQFNHLKMLMDNPLQGDRNEKMEQEIHNMQHIFNLYQVLIKKDNLVELRLILFLDRYNFCMLGLVLQNNTNLRILEVRNMITKDRDKDLDYTFKEMNEYGDNIRDEIFIFFNYLFAEDNITELSLTHFNFFSEINFMAAQAAKTMKNLQILNLESNVGLVNNDDVMANAYNLAFLPMVKLNMGMTYFRMIRNWDSLINPFNLQFLDAGVCDFTSFCSLCRYLEYTKIEKVIVRLNKPVIFESIPVFFDIITGAPMRSKYLKYFYVLNSVDESVKSEKMYKKNYLPKLFNCLRYNKVMRKLSFAKPSKNYFEIRDDKEDEGDFKTFKYIKKRDYDKAITLLKAMKKLFGNYKGNNENEVNDLIKNIIIYRFLTFRKFMTG